jgi:hypothetical protein
MAGMQRWRGAEREYVCSGVRRFGALEVWTLR